MYKKIIKIISFLIITSVLICGCTKTKNEDVFKEEKEVKIGILGNDYPINRATVCKMLALANYTKNEIIAFDTAITFDDIGEDDWYEKYINTAYIKGDISGVSKNKFEPMGNLTIMQTQYLIEKYDKTKKIKINDTNKDKPVSYALWCDIYTQLMKDKNIITDSLIIIATKENASKLEEDYAITDKGLFSFEGLNPNLYINKKIKVLRKDTEIIAITEVLDIEPTLKRCVIKNISKDYIEISIGGANKILNFKDMEIKDGYGLCDIKIKDDNIVSIEYYNDVLRGNTNKITENSIRLNNTNYVLDEDFKVYFKNGEEINYKHKKDLIIGQNIASYFTKGNENKIYGAIIDTELNIEKIRVAINDNSYNNLYFENIQLSSKSGIKVFVKGKESQVETLNIKNGQDFNIGENEIIIIEPIKKEDGIIFENLIRGYEKPIFYDKIEICKTNNKYTFINEISIEDYIESVLISSANEYKEKEFLKTLATIYRSYAIAYINENNLYKIGANLDDSSKYQLFNNKKNDEKFNNIIEETKGQIITNNNEPLKGSYFGYSCGTTANSGEIWAGKDFFEYPSQSKDYLKSTTGYTETVYGNLNDETNANIFFKTKDIEAIEKDSQWFRWSSILEESDIKNIDKNIKELYKTNKNLIKTVENGKYIYKPIETLGDIKDIKIIERGIAGNVMKMEIIGDKETVLIMTDSIIKRVLKPSKVINNNGENVDIKTIPSSYFVFDKVYDNNGKLKKLTFYGGGYGHGVGLSLYGAEKLALSGKNYEEILNYYYSNIKIDTI